MTTCAAQTPRAFSAIMTLFLSPPPPPRLSSRSRSRSRSLGIAPTHASYCDCNGSTDGYFSAVWALSENTLKVTSLDTTTDSNTRERLPYEADGLITGDSRIALQREFAWPKHSWRHNTWNPTWPTEWRQSVALFAQQEYMLTGDLDLVNSFAASLLNQTQIGCVATSSTGLVDYGTCPHQSGGMGVQSKIRDIVDWPEESRDGYVMGNINTGECSLFTITFDANPAHNLTRSP